MLDIHQSIKNKLNYFHEMHKIPNILFHGPTGSGKRTIVNDFEYIVDTCKFFGLPSNKLSLHLHVKNGREDIVEKIIHKALDRRILDFDVSLLETGGCSVTMNKNQIAPNLSYDLYYKSLVNYIEKNIEE